MRQEEVTTSSIPRRGRGGSGRSSRNWDNNTSNLYDGWIYRSNSFPLVFLRTRKCTL